jgi:hypothetical protein
MKAMSQRISRPPSVLITQVILIMVGGIWLVGGLLHLFATFMTSTAPAQIIVNVIFGLLILAFSISFLTGFWGLVKRKRYGRWIGVIGLSLLLLSILLGNVIRPAGPLTYDEYKNRGEVVWAVIAAIIFYGLIILLIYRLTRGKRANAFFAGETAATSEPPPPSFEE